MKIILATGWWLKVTNTEDISQIDDNFRIEIGLICLCLTAKVLKCLSNSTLLRFTKREADL